MLNRKILRNNARNVEAALMRGQALVASGDTDTAIKYARARALEKTQAADRY